MADRKARRWRGAALGLAVLVFLGTRLVSIQTVAANWDEFALMERAARTLDSGVLQGGGHPGLAEILVLPFVGGCDDELEALRRARLVWLGLSCALLAGLGVCLGQLFEGRPRRWHDAALGVALLALVPAFLEWSIQVRADQVALAGGAWGAAALLASRRRPAWALAAGAALGVGLLGTQKLFYVAALAGLLALGQLRLAREWRWRRELSRAGLCAAAFAAVLLAFRALTAHGFEVAETHASQRALTPEYLRSGLSMFEFYRKTLGFSQYRAMLPTLWAHGALFAALIATTALAWKRRRPLDALLLAWAILASGLAVALFHAGAFAYFWMTLGLFPAVAFAVALAPIREQLLPALGSGRRLTAAATWLLAVAPGVAHAGWLLSDSQAVQRESLAFVHRNFDPDDAGFHPESGMFCRRRGQPLRTYFSQTIYRHFAGPKRALYTDRMLSRFREEPVEFIVQSFRLNQFPLELRRFWSENYQPYRASVFVAGRHLAGARGSAEAFELIVPGEYRWLPFRGPQPVQLDGRLLAPGATARLESGEHEVRFVEDVPGGILVLALNDPPGPAPLAFYKDY